MPIWFFALGVLHTPLYTFPLPVIELLIVTCFGASCLVLSQAQSSRTWHKILFALMCFVFGTALGGFQVNKLCRQQLDPIHEGMIQEVVFQVISIPVASSKSKTFLAKILSLTCTSRESPPAGKSCPELSGKKIRLSWYYSAQNIQAGQIWQASVKLKRPRGFVNPQGFDYQAWLLAQDVSATGYVRGRKDTNPVLLETRQVWASVRQKTKERLLEEGEFRFERFWAALLIGDRSAISKEDWSVLQTTGTVHLMAISGLHVGFVALACFGLGGLVMRTYTLLGRGSGVFAYRFLPALFSIGGALYYAALAGFSIPTLRALVACTVVNLCLMAGVKISSSRVLGLCVAVVAVLEPLAWTNTGFWLSFAAVGLLMFSFGARKGGRSTWAWLKIQLVLSIGMLVPIVFIGQGFSLVSPFANIISVPLISLLIVPLLLIASLIQLISESAAHWIMCFLDMLFLYLWHFLTYLHGVSFARLWPDQVINLYVLVVGFIGSLLLLAPIGLRCKGLGFIWLCCAGWGKMSSDESFSLTVLDVGQGLSVHVQTPEDSWLYDAGPIFSENFDSGSGIIAPYLRRLGLQQSSLIVSHSDLDHSGGVQGLMDSIAIQNLYLGEPLSGITEQGIACEQGQNWQSGSLHFRVLWPPAGSQLEGNRASCVVYMEYQGWSGDIRVLFTGDIDRFVERQLQQSLPSSIDILIAPHHGSNSSSSAAFISRVDPKYVVFSSGFNNRYRHPSAKVVKRYQQHGALMYSTAINGAVSFVLKAGDDLHIETLRSKEAKLWYRTDIW